MEPWEATGEDLKRQWRAAILPELSECEKKQPLPGEIVARTSGGESKLGKVLNG